MTVVGWSDRGSGPYFSTVAAEPETCWHESAGAQTHTWSLTSIKLKPTLF